MTVTFERARKSALWVYDIARRMNDKDHGLCRSQENDLLNEVSYLKSFFSQEETVGSELKEFEGLEELLDKLDEEKGGCHQISTRGEEEWFLEKVVDCMVLKRLDSAEAIMSHLREKVAATEEVSFEEAAKLVEDDADDIEPLKRYFSQEKVRRDAKEEKEE